ncbi:NO-inducible flavohemoprotein [uncultured Methylophaga sp.]|uniref:NO-inducible flavohemoprotein n=1 Tax=uncultured Methylophaga sp. TaxID=285271 RepID=UPI002610547D|nr:NO-inducible flavohemoprotein [uncultured Methylophaga sp.]
MIKPQTLQVIKATVPVLKTHGEALTRLFYQRMFENNPEVKAYFNQAHQHSGSQQQALATAICAYAENIDNPEALSAAVELIAQKHASLGIKPEHYPIVGQNLLLAIKELLGDDASDDIIDAWAEAYQALAEIFIEREKQIYTEHEVQHGWQGFKQFEVIRREKSSEVITSFYLQPADGQPLAAHQAGQYITVKLKADGPEHTMRQYSLSNPPGKDYYRISVKRETGSEKPQPDGLVSNFLHDKVKPGDLLWLAPPCGEFTLQSPVDKPVVMIAGGVGITPLLSMLHQHLTDRSQRVTLIQATINGQTRAFKQELDRLEKQYSEFDCHVRYSQPSDEDKITDNHDSEGLIDAALINSLDLTADFYLCGPPAMMRHCLTLLNNAGVTSEQIHLEAFGPALPLAS